MKYGSTNTVFTMETVPLKFGWGASREIGYDLAALGVRKTMLLTDPHMQLTGVPDDIASLIRARGIDVTIYDRVQVEPTDTAWREAIDFAIAGAFDSYVAVGGGSTIDTAKAVNLFATYPASLLTYINKPIGEGRPVPGPLKPLFAVPTTAGTGSETTAVAIVDLLELKLKTGISHRYLRPRLAIVDPELTLSCPAAVTASAGIDVLCHAIESYTARRFDTFPRPEEPAQRPAYVGANPVSDLWSLAAIDLASAYLLRAFETPGDREAREGMMLAATYAGMGFGNAGVHIPHAMSYAIAGMVKGFVPDGYPAGKAMVPHGVSVALGAPATFRRIGSICGELMLEVLESMGHPIEHVAEAEAGDAVADRFVELMRAMRLPNGLTALGYQEADLPELGARALEQKRLLTLSPIDITPADLADLFERSMHLW